MNNTLFEDSDLETQMQEQIDLQVQEALSEDIGSLDLTASLIPPNLQARGEIICKENGILCGQPWVEKVFHQLDPATTLHWLAQEAQPITSGETICILNGSARALLSGERSALNFLQTLSGTATTTYNYRQLLKNTRTQLLDTRKTLPGLRIAQKYAVRCGGGVNHRLGLYDAILIKENHIAAVGSLTETVRIARQLHPQAAIEVETETIEEVTEALAVGVEVIMLDEFSMDDIHAALKLINGRAKVEVSGNIDTPDTLIQLAMTGVDFISMGALTKHVHALDLSMKINSIQSTQLL